MGYHTNGQPMDYSVTTEVMTITAELAAEWLKRNIANRPMASYTAVKYAGAIERGEWQLNGESIKFDKHGNLLDGQHRLQAVIISGIPIRSLVVRNLDREVFSKIDIGRVRGGADVLAMMGEKNYATLAAALTWLWKYENGFAIASNQKLSHDQLKLILQQHPGMRDAVSYVCGKKDLRRLAPQSLVAFLYYEMRKRHPDLAAWFFEKLDTGAGMEVDQGVYRLRERLLANASAKAKLKYPEIMALAIKAWNCHRVNAKVRCLVWRSEGPAAEPFPKIA